MNRSIKRPIELAGFSSRLARAEKLEGELAVTGGRYDTVLNDIDDQHQALRDHVGSLEQTRSTLDQVIARMTAGSNGGPNDGQESSGDSSTGSAGQGADGGAGQVITSTTAQAEG